MISNSYSITLFEGAEQGSATCIQGRAIDSNEKVAIVTGGASGIGAATVRRLLDEGARAVIGDLDGARRRGSGEGAGRRRAGVQFDAGDTASIEALVATTVSHFGRLDILHNNAAIMAADVIAQDTNPVDIDLGIWDLTMAVNLRGIFAGLPYRSSPHAGARSGSIIMTASGSGKSGDLSRTSPTARRRRA